MDDDARSSTPPYVHGRSRQSEIVDIGSSTRTPAPTRWRHHGFVADARKGRQHQGIQFEGSSTRVSAAMTGPL